jgi:hypothetical protein
MKSPSTVGRSAWTVVTVALVTGVVGHVALIGADARWLAALGHLVVRDHAIPTGIPFAAAPTSHWPNTLVLAELIFYGLERLMGDPGLLLAQTLAVGAALTILARDAHASGAGAPRTCQALLLVTLGSLTSFGLARVQLFSLVLFPLLLALLRADQRSRSRRIWLTLPLLALWSNLHGIALVGLAMLYLYLIFSLGRVKPVRAGALAVLSLVAMCVTPAGLRTVDYYYGLTTNLATERGTGLWAPLGTGLLDLLLIFAAIWLAVRAWRGSRAPLWELIAVLVLGALTVKAARNGVWLLFLLAVPAARSGGGRRDWAGLIPLAAAAAIALLVTAVIHWAGSNTGTPRAVSRAVQLAGGSPVLAEPLLAEQIALAGARIWAGDPIDAFSRPAQAAYLDFVAGSPGGRAALDRPDVRVVAVIAGDAAAHLVAQDSAFRKAEVIGNTEIYLRRS